MNFIKDRANVCKTCACSDKLKAKRVLFGSYTTPFKFTDSFGFNITVQQNPVIQAASCEQALVKTNRKSIQNHQSKTMLLFKT